MSTSDEERAILQLVYDLKHPTRDQLYNRLYPTARLSRRQFDRKIQRLLTLRLISDKEKRTQRLILVHAEEGRRSKRYLHLLLAGARELGLEKLGSNHYRRERTEFAAHRTTLQELEFLAQKRGWKLISDDLECRSSLRDFMHKVIVHRTGRGIPIHTVWVPAKISPDRVLITSKETILCIIAHPHASDQFWKRRLEKYQTMLRTDARAIAITLNPDQHRECQQVAEEFDLARRILILDVSELQLLETRLK